MSQIRAEYLNGQIQRLQATISHLENTGVEIYNNAPPSVIKNEEKEKRRQKENYLSEIYKSGEDILVNLRKELNDYQKELAELGQKVDR